MALQSWPGARYAVRTWEHAAYLFVLVKLFKLHKLSIKTAVNCTAFQSENFVSEPRARFPYEGWIETEDRDVSSEQK